MFLKISAILSILVAIAMAQVEIVSVKRGSEREMVSPFEHRGHAEARVIKRDSMVIKEKRAAIAASAANIAIVLNSHNKYRAQEGAANMNKMKYSTYLAEMAKEWANGCNFVHGHPARTNAPWNWIGQNLYAVSVPKINYTRAVLAWYNEKKDYTFSTTSCAAGKNCGHYTQLVWWESENVGCAANICPTLGDTPFTNAGFIVCNYGPGGNYVGEKPFTPGAACSACPAGKTCDGGLCA